MERDPLDRTIVMKITKKPQGVGNVPGPRLLKRDAAPKSPEETEKAMAALASLYRLFRG